MSETAGGPSVRVALCPVCDWRYIVPEEVRDVRCPHCAGASLTWLDDEGARFIDRHPPELVVPLDIDATTLEARVRAFADGIPYAPLDLNTGTLRQRLTTMYLPMWLVDGDVLASWEAEVGFEYDVLSHQEQYSDGSGWATRQVTERRVRWEPRVGRLSRHYDNVKAPALEAHPRLWQALGGYDLQRAAAFDATRVPVGLVRIPDRLPEAAWSEAQKAFWEAAAEECRVAASANRIRGFRWEAAFTATHWTLLWLPVLASFYEDDEGVPRPVLLNGQSGQIVGVRRASMRRAQKVSLIVAGIAAALIVLAMLLGLVGIAVPPVLMVAALLGVVGIVLGIGALAPILRAWRFNRQESMAKSANA